METLVIENTYQSVRTEYVPKLPVPKSQHLPSPFIAAIKSDAVMGAAGAGIIAAIMYTMWAAKKGPKPMFLDLQQSQFGEHGAIDHVAGLARFGIAGAVWGALFGAYTRQPTVAKGALFGLLPSLFVWTVGAKRKGQPFFFGFKPDKILMPILFNSVIWGGFMGKMARRSNI